MKTLRCLFGHKWKDCMCSRCGSDQEERHRFEKIAGKCREKCIVCGKTRSMHVLRNEKCPDCGETEQTILDRKDALLRELKSASDWEKRRDAAKELEDYPYPDTVAILISTLQRDEHRVVRFKCAQSLGRIGDRVSVEPLISSLGDNEFIVVKYSAEALGIIGDERAIEPLIRNLNPSDHPWGTDYAPVRASQEALGKFGARVTHRLLEILDNPAIYREVIGALALTGDIEALPALIACARDSETSPSCRVEAVEGLAKIDHGDRTDTLLGLLESESNPALILAVKRSIERLGIEASDKLAQAEQRAEETFLNNLKALKVGMSESDVEKLVGGGVFQMGTRRVYKPQYGEFQLIIDNGKLVHFPGGFGPAGLIKEMEAKLLSRK